MSGTLEWARERLGHAQRMLELHRAFVTEVGVPLDSRYERDVLKALDDLWHAQCCEIFEDHADGFFQTDKCRRAVNAVDWKQTRGNIVVFKDFVEGFF